MKGKTLIKLFVCVFFCASMIFSFVRAPFAQTVQERLRKARDAEAQAAASSSSSVVSRSVQSVRKEAVPPPAKGLLGDRGLRECGEADPFRTGQSGMIDKDPALSCFGESVIDRCRKARFYLRRDIPGKAEMQTNGDPSDCRLILKDTRGGEVYLSASCSVEKLLTLNESADKSKPGLLAFQLMIATSFGTANSVTAEEYGCKILVYPPNWEGGRAARSRP